MFFPATFRIASPAQYPAGISEKPVDAADAAADVPSRRTTVSNNVKICGNCMIGAGAVVVRDIKIAGTYIGIPARKTEREH